MSPQRFIIYSLARTGSTTLMQLLNCHPSIRCVYEPFNPGNPAEYRHLVDHERRLWGLSGALDLLWTHCNSFKHVVHANGWPFQQSPELNEQLLRTPGIKVLLLDRRNILQRAISVQISAQMQVWNTLREEDRRRIQAHTFTALDVDKLRTEMAGDRPLLARALQSLKDAKTTWLRIAYENLFAPELSMETRIGTLQSLLSFLGFDPITDQTRLDEIRKLFDPVQTGFQNAAAYAKIPNIREVDGLLGSPDTGFVFNPPLPTAPDISGDETSHGGGNFSGGGR